MMKDELDTLIQRHQSVPMASPHFAARIIDAASHIEQKLSIWHLIQLAFQELRLPTPTYSLASLLIIGFVTGFMSYSSTSLASDDSTLEHLLYGYEESL